MSPASPLRRRADEFARLVDTVGAKARPAGELGDLVALATALREHPTVSPRAAFSADLRERLMAVAATELTPAADKATEEPSVADKLTVRGLGDRSGSGRRRRRLTAGVVVAVLIGGTAGTAYASQSSLPGDTLYPVKRAVENVRTGLSSGDGSKGRLVLGDADTRLSEVQRLTKSGQPADADQVSKTLETFSSQATRASDLLLSDYRQHQNPASIKKLRSFAAGGIDQLAAIGATVPASAKGALSDAAQTLVLIDQAAAAVCPDCGSGITQLPSTLLSGLSSTLDGLAPDLLPGSLTGSDTTPQASGSKDQPKSRQPSGTNGPAITLPSVDPSSLLPGSLTGALGGADNSDNNSGSTSNDSTDSKRSTGSDGSKDSTGSTSTDSGSKKSGGSSAPTPSPTSLGDALGGTVDGVVSGVGGLVGGVVGGLTGSGG